MLREIKNDLYCITFYNGNKRLVECERGEELIVYVAEMQRSSGFICYQDLRRWQHAYNRRQIKSIL